MTYIPASGLSYRPHDIEAFVRYIYAEYTCYICSFTCDAVLTRANVSQILGRRPCA